MIALFFEVTPLSGHAQRYFELAAVLKPELERNGGLLFIDRYTSVERPDVVLSHSLWENEEHLIRWREHSKHRAVQLAGRERHFRDYRLRIARLADPSRITDNARYVWASHYEAEPNERTLGELYQSVYRERKFLVVGDGVPVQQDMSTNTQTFEIVRDYTMHDRAEAPQQYPPVARSR
ncbi:antibiotic biosynthesis monooxygenase family protein [Bradyrhizobium uaiense]|uniref:Antibiotic biosynthesis monooxygenase n=1 Tax=Bradyrhizobium uaiense TaxID=2594946 RepID=A0A6P1BSW0_9BRAD|nr:antibiotic biosynthesis monooxygenase [Bradyrhizobium uaiense]NEV00652.1 antibiotic biosynthesis monooxygenase [Bradyrhizobium uaiense]